jgi:23S rRNA (guanosine2251-2'-O)-methyltransferase
MNRKLKNTELQRIEVSAYDSESKLPVCVVLDNVRSLHNIGSVFRTADAFRIKQLLLCGITACPPHREIEKTALGATQSVPWKYFPDTLAPLLALKSEEYKIVCIEQTVQSISLDEFEIEKSDQVVLVFGHEINGVSQNIIDVSDVCVEIPQFGTKHSFNISVSAGIVLWDLFMKLTHITKKP